MKISAYKNRALDFGRPVRVYRNLHKGGYSVMQKGRVVAHADELHLVDVKFVVQESGRKRTLREGRKCVHAFAVGRLSVGAKEWSGTLMRLGRYRPANGHFEVISKPYDRETWLPLRDAPCVLLDRTGLWVYGDE